MKVLEMYGKLSRKSRTRVNDYIRAEYRYKPCTHKRKIFDSWDAGDIERDQTPIYYCGDCHQYFKGTWEEYCREGKYTNHK